MGISKLIINNQVKLDLTNDTIAPDYGMASNIYIDQNKELLVSNMLTGRSNRRPINIFCNNLSLLTANDVENSIVGNDITWTEMTNGYYNSSYNIYLYNNYSKETGLIS